MTAVEWFASEINGMDTAVSINAFKELFEQAKEMEKQQMKMAQMHYSSDVVGFKALLEKQFEDWYNETFKTK